MNRREFVRVTAAAVTPLFATTAHSAEVISAVGPARPPKLKAFEWEEATIAQLQAAMKSGRTSAVSLVQKYLERIDEVDRKGPQLNSVIELNPDAEAIAKALDRERKEKGPRGPLHGIPILLKDNLDTHDRMMTTAGSLAMLGSHPTRDSFVAQQLRAAGAVILGKTNLSEWANFRGERSSSGWSGRGGQTRNPYALDRNPSGSSSGSAAAVSANLCAAAIGTETDGSIISPSTICGIVGIKPTVGLVSRAGIIPIGHSQDTAGPMARSVTDAAILLSALTGVDQRDAATRGSEGRAARDYTRFLEPTGLRGARLGVARPLFRRGMMARPLESVLEEMKSAGAVLVDFTDDLGKFGPAEQERLLYEFKADLHSYLSSLGEAAPVKTLKDIIDFNERNRETELAHFGQELLLKANEKGPLTEKGYLDAMKKCMQLSRDEGIDAVMRNYRLDAIVAPSGGPAGKTDWIYGDRNVGGSSSPAAVAGYPNITVPAGDLAGLPFGISFFGAAYSEPTLIRLAYAFEQRTKARRVPKLLASVG